MTTYAFMALLLLGLAVTALWGVKTQPDKDGFLSQDDAAFLRGFWCVIVVLVHVPAAYQNRVQDMMGSFAYIGVTFFFMTSAYGLAYSVAHKPGYAKRFWRRRLPPLLIPALIANSLSVGVRLLGGKQVSALSVINVDSWVKALLVNYVIFWAVYCLIPDKIGGGWKQIAVFAICVGWSLTERLTGRLAMGWVVERLGFAYGVLLAAYYKQVNAWIHHHWAKKTVALMFLSLFLGLAYLRYKPIAFYGDYLLRILLGVALTAFVMEALSGFRVGNAINRWLGAISYEVYLLHEVVFAALILAKPNLHSGAFIVSAIVITAASGYGLKALSGAVMRALPDWTE